jgi:hypothetical protein
MQSISSARTIIEVDARAKMLVYLIGDKLIGL